MLTDSIIDTINALSLTGIHFSVRFSSYQTVLKTTKRTGKKALGTVIKTIGSGKYELTIADRLVIKWIK